MLGTFTTIVGGSGGTNGVYPNVVLTGGTGSGATANITVSGGVVTAVAILNPGVNYTVGDFLSAASGNIGGVSGFSALVGTTAINSSLVGGTVGMYIPGTLTTKQTWADAAETILNTNPVPLDLNGCAVMYGAGTYRQIVYDRLGDVVWDQPTTAPAPNPVYAGLAGGTANAITVVDTAFSGSDGQSITFLAANTNTGATTLNPSGFGAIQVVKNTSSGPVALSGSEIVGGAPGNIITVTYSSVYNEFFMGNPLASGSSGSSVPTGAVMGFALSACPTGWIAANGTGGTINLVGTVARGYDPTNTRDPNGSSQSIGSYETAMMQQHQHSSGDGGFIVNHGAGGSVSVGSGVVDWNSTTNTGNVVSASVGNETRAASTIVLYCQKS